MVRFGFGTAQHTKFLHYLTEGLGFSVLQGLRTGSVKGSIKVKLRLGLLRLFAVSSKSHCTRAVLSRVGLWCNMLL